MGTETGIQWCDHTFNPWIGCAKVSSGCDFCYAEAAQDHRYHRVRWGKDGTRYKTKQGTWKNPYKWDKDAKRDGVRRKVFCASLSDWAEDRSELVPWRVELFDEIEKRQQLDWLMLTKRPDFALKFINERYGYGGFMQKFPHVWQGTSVENQAAFEHRWPLLKALPGAVRFLSVEPLLKPVVLPDDFLSAKNVWVIIGGESRDQGLPRPFLIQWAEALIKQCKAAGVPVFMKQIGGMALTNPDYPRESAGSEPFMTDHPKGGEMKEWPQALRVRQFPKVVAS